MHFISHWKTVCVYIWYFCLCESGKLSSVSSSLDISQRLKPPFQWIHPTKTGSSFGNELFALTCPEQAANIALAKQNGDLDRFSVVRLHGIQGISKECRKRWHMQKFDALYQSKTRDQWIIGEHYGWSSKVSPNSTFITLRSPLNRLRSFMEWRKIPCTKKDLEKVRKTMSMRIKVRNEKHVRFLWRSYVDQLANAKLSLDQKKSLSCERITLSAWIGLTDYFAASICLLMQTYPHTPHPLNISNMRKTEKNTDNKNMCSPNILREMRFPEIESDQDVYNCAVRTFAERMLKFGPHCVKHIGSITPYEPVQARNI